ncbi:DUF5995 family protein [Halosegnis marinus]|uniref:DUF5995 family protein n=1 Tax=Halosegnis marinus TaxID=3034023 RepID=A0ABD5ZMJ8_9EURY|nr:DUF5995 family protein [Halosegnis sp. DT85]
MQTPFGPLNREALRAVAAALGRDPFPPGEGAVGVADLLSDPYADPADAHRRLALAERRFVRAGDRRAVFLTVYGAVTARVRRDLAGDRFADPEWVAGYLVAFANRYRRALLAYERDDRERVPRAWLLAFDGALAGETLVAQDALLGINAHVVHDLALALDDAGIDPRAERRRDHDAVNAVLRALVDTEQDLLADRYAPGLGTLDAAAGRFDERAAFRTLAEGRDWAWRCAVALADGGPLARRGVRWLLDAVSLGAGRLLVRPTRDERVRERLRAAERGGEPRS